VGVIGLSRLRVWAVLLHLGVNAVVIVLLLFASRLTGSLLWILVGSAVVQLLLPVRMLLAFRRGATARDRDTELPALLAVMVIVALMLGSIPFGLYGTYAFALQR
jgi:hypothetical protein